MPATETLARRVTCRYIRKNEERCTGEVLDPNAPVQLCGKHTARVLEHARETFARFRRESRR